MYDPVYEMPTSTEVGGVTCQHHYRWGLTAKLGHIWPTYGNCKPPISIFFQPKCHINTIHLRQYFMYEFEKCNASFRRDTCLISCKVKNITNRRPFWIT